MIRHDRQISNSSDLVANASKAYQRGDHDAVLALTADPASPAGELLLIRARSLFREHRFDAVEALLGDQLDAFSDLNRSAAARMLHAAAVARRDPKKGLEMLAAAHAWTDRTRVHPSVRAEIAYHRAQIHWRRGDLGDAERLARTTEIANVDILAVKATRLRGLIAITDARFVDALRLFETAHRANAHWRERSDELDGQILQQVASLEQTLRCDTIRGTHRQRQLRTILRRLSISGTKSASCVRTLGDDAWLFALDGDGAAACAKAREALHAAPTAAWQVRGLAGRAAIASAFREDSVASTFVEEAWTLSRSIDWQTVSGAERLSLLSLADASAMFDGDRAARVLAVYDASTPQTGSPARRWPADLRVRGWEAYVRASTARARRDSIGAAALYAAALDDFRTCSYRWREAETLFALAALPPEARCDQIRAPLDEAVTLVRRHLPDSFLARRVAGWRRIFIDPCGVRLSPAQRDVLRLVLEGRSLRAIASSKGRDYETIKSHARAVHRSFGTRDNHQLVAECARRGIFPPSFEQSS